jgi:hypothetical protein
MSDDQATNVVVDCSQGGAPDQEIAASFREAALAAIDAGDIERATKLMAEAKDVLAASQVTPAEAVELTDDEAANITSQQDVAQTRIALEQYRALGELIARCDRYLAQTDWIMLPAAARPTDMSANLAQACDDNSKAWTKWRAAVKTIRDAAAAGTADPDDPGFPDQPAAPAVVLT